MYRVSSRLEVKSLNMRRIRASPGSNGRDHRLPGCTVGGLAQRFERFPRVHARSAKEINGRRPDLAYEHAGPEVVTFLQYGGRPSRGFEGEPAGLHGMLRLLDVGRKGLDGAREVEKGLRERLRGDLSLAYRRCGGAGEHPDVSHGKVQLVSRRSVEPELAERPPARRREPCGVVAGVERFPESTHTPIYIARLLQCALGPAEVVLSQRCRRLL